MSITNLNVNDLLAALALPSAALVQQRVPKKMLAENGAATLADRKLVQDGIDEFIWHAALKPTNAGIVAYEDELRSYLEVAVLSVRLRTEAAADSQLRPQAVKVSNSVKRLAEWVHRAVPYPTVLLIEEGVQLFASMAHIRWAQREAEKTVLDGDSIIVHVNSDLPEGVADGSITAFLESLALSKQPRSHMLTLYQGWFDTLSAWQAAPLIGEFKRSDTPTQAAERRAALHECKDLDDRIAAARSVAAKEKQLARQVAANLEIKALLAERQRVVQSL